jgi:transposase
MFINWETIELYIKPGATDMRKQIRGLSMLVESEQNLNPFSGNLFLFSGKNRKLIKILYWDKTGFAMWQKRLEKQKFPWPKTENDVKQINVEQFKMLLSGIDFWNAHQELFYESTL